MKKIFITLILNLILLSGCFNNKVENPVKQYESLQQINKNAIVYIAPLNQQEATEEVFYIIDNNTAVYGYKLNGYDYYQRGCKDTSIDMSGIFKNGSTLFSNKLEDKIAYEQTDEYKVYRFILGNKQYIFGVYDLGKLDKEVFDQQFSEVYLKTINDGSSKIVKDLVGDYYDTTSQRATAQASLIDINTLGIDVTWSSSENEYDEWIVETNYEYDRLTYSNISHLKVTTDENGNTDIKDLQDYCEGYFEIKDSKLLWTGSGNKQTSSCEFKKAQ